MPQDLRSNHHDVLSSLKCVLIPKVLLGNETLAVAKYLQQFIIFKILFFSMERKECLHDLGLQIVDALIELHLKGLAHLDACLENACFELINNNSVQVVSTDLETLRPLKDDAITCETVMGCMPQGKLDNSALDMKQPGIMMSFVLCYPHRITHSQYHNPLFKFPLDKQYTAIQDLLAGEMTTSSVVPLLCLLLFR